MPSLTLNKIAICLNIAIILAIIIILTSEQAKTSSLLEGDFPGFYVLAKIITDYQSSSLYDLELQTKIQNQYWPGMAGGVLISVYPPATALLLGPLGYFSAEVAQLLFRLLSLAALFYSFNYLYLHLREANARLSGLFLFSILLSHPFILIGSLGGQNTAFSLAIICVSLSLLKKAFSKKSKVYEFFSGLAFSLWLLKPQYGVFLFPALIFFRLRYALTGFISGALLHYMAGCILIDYQWPLFWLEKISKFSDINYQSNLNNQASIISLVKVLTEKAEIFDYKPYLTKLLLISLLLTGLIYFFASIKNRTSNNSANMTISVFWLYISLIILLSPQALFYDLGISYFALLVLACSTKDLKQILSLWLLSWLITLFRNDYGFILFPLINFTFFLCCLMALKITSPDKHQGAE